MESESIGKRIANLTLRSREPGNFNTKISGVGYFNEMAAMRNFITLSRAINPFRRITQVYETQTAYIRTFTRQDDVNAPANKPIPLENPLALGSAVSKKSISALNATTSLFKNVSADSRFGPFIAAFSVLNPAGFAHRIGRAIVREEISSYARSTQKELSEDTALRFTGLYQLPMFFKSSELHVRKLPISDLFDPIFEGEVYGLNDYPMIATALPIARSGFSPTRGSNADSQNNSALLAAIKRVSPFDDEGELAGGNTDIDIHGVGAQFMDFAQEIVFLDFVMNTDLLREVFNTQKFELYQTTDQRIASAYFLADLSFVISSQPYFYVLSLIYQFLENAMVKDVIKMTAPDFYGTEMYQAFSQAIEAIPLSPIVQWLLEQGTSSTINTVYGNGDAILIPTILSAFLTSETTPLDVLVDFTSLEKSIQYQSAQMAGGTAKTLLAARRQSGRRKSSEGDAIFSYDTPINVPSWKMARGSIEMFLTDFVTMFSHESNLSSKLKAAGDAVHYKAGVPKTGHPIDLVNPTVIVTDGWVATSPLTYEDTQTSLLLSTKLTKSPTQMRTALIQAEMMKLRAEDDLGVGSFMFAQGTKYSYDLPDRDHGWFGKYDEPAPPLLVRKDADHAFYSSGAASTLRGFASQRHFLFDPGYSAIEWDGFVDFSQMIGFQPYVLRDMLIRMCVGNFYVGTHTITKKIGELRANSEPVGYVNQENFEYYKHRFLMSIFVSADIVDSVITQINEVAISSNLPVIKTLDEIYAPIVDMPGLEGWYFTGNFYYQSERTRMFAACSAVRPLMAISDVFLIYAYNYGPNLIYTDGRVLEVTAHPFGLKNLDMTFSSTVRLDEMFHGLWGSTPLMPKGNSGL
jgi:hypothetical protein